MVCAIFSDLKTWADVLVYPTSCNYYIYLVFFVAIFITLTLILFNREREQFAKADMISSLGVSSIATLFLALIGTLIENSDGIPMVQENIFMYVLAFTIVFILIWFFKK